MLQIFNLSTSKKKIVNQEIIYSTIAADDLGSALLNCSQIQATGISTEIFEKAEINLQVVEQCKVRPLSPSLSCSVTDLVFPLL